MAIDLTNKELSFVLKFKTQVSALLTAYEACQDLRIQYDALAYSGALLDGAFTGENNHLDNTVVGNAFTSLDAIKTLMGQGHATNLYKVVR